MSRLRRLGLPSPVSLRRTWTVFRPALAGQGPALRACFGLSLLVSVLELARPWPIKFVFDRVLGGDGEEWILWAAAGATFLIPLAIGQLSARVLMTSARVSRKVTTRIRAQVFEHLHRLAVPFHQAHRSGDLLVRLMGDVNMVRDLLFASWLNLVTRGALLAGTLLIMVNLDFGLTLAALLPLPLLSFVVGRSSPRMKEVTRKQRRREGDSAAFAAESLRQIRVVKAYTAEDRATEEFTRSTRSSERAGMESARLAGKVSRATEALTGAGLAFVLLLGGRRVGADALTPGELLVVMSYTRMLYKPVRKVSGEGGRLSKALACSERLVEVLRAEPEPIDRGQPVPRFDGEVAVRGVFYTYPGGTRALQDVSFVVPAGGLVVLAGHNGSGKSTMLSILLRLIEPDWGVVLVDGQPIEAFRLDAYRRRIAFVPQDPQLFGASIRDNILYGEPEAPAQVVEDAARAALLGEVVTRIPGGLDAVLGENGASLSGGEARRLMLARAAVRDARLLVLDEPLAGLDPEARPLVAQAIRRIAAGRTTIVVSHGTIDDLDPDLIVHLADGRVAGIDERRPRRMKVVP